MKGHKFFRIAFSGTFIFLAIAGTASAASFELGLGNGIMGIAGFFILLFVLSKMFGRKAGDAFGGAVRSEERETFSDVLAERRAGAEEAASESELEGAEKLLGVDVVKVEQIKNFLEQIERARLTPDYARKIAKLKGKALRNAVRNLLNYSARTKKAVDVAYRQNLDAMRRISREVRERLVVDARAERSKMAREKDDKKLRAFDETIQKLQNRNEAFMADIRNKEAQVGRNDERIEQLLTRVTSAEKQVAADINEMISALSKGNVYGATSAATLAIRSLNFAEGEFGEARQFIEVVRKEVEGIIAELRVSQSSLNKERLEEHYEAANYQRI